MSEKSLIPQAIAFVDGQNLFHAAKQAFGYALPNYDPCKLATAVCRTRGWKLRQTRFYTGIPTENENPKWHRFWTRKLLAISRSGAHVHSRPLRYRKNLTANGIALTIGEEKGIDVRIAIDILSCAIRGHCDVVLVFSQDQDLSEVADEIRTIAGECRRWLKIASAFPISLRSNNRRGIDRTDWIRIGRDTYDACIDPQDY